MIKRPVLLKKLIINNLWCIMSFQWLLGVLNYHTHRHCGNHRYTGHTCTRIRWCVSRVGDTCVYMWSVRWELFVLQNNSQFWKNNNWWIVLWNGWILSFTVCCQFHQISLEFCWLTVPDWVDLSVKGNRKVSWLFN